MMKNTEKLANEFYGIAFRAERLYQQTGEPFYLKMKQDSERRAEQLLSEAKTSGGPGRGK